MANHPDPPPQRSIVSDVLTSGISHQVDRRHRSPFQLTTGENARLVAPGRYSKRPGVAFIERNIEGASDLSSVNTLNNADLAYSGDETVLIKPEGLYSYMPTYGKFVKRGNATSHTTDVVGTTNAYVSIDTGKPAHHVDMAVNADQTYACVVSVTRDTSGFTLASFTGHIGVMTFSIVDLVTGATVFTSTPFYDVHHVRVVYLSTPDVFTVVWRDGVDILAQSFAMSNPTSSSSLLTQRTILTTTESYSLFDAVQCSGEGSYFYLVTQDDAGGGTWPVSLHRVTASGSPTGDNFTVSTFASYTTTNGRKVALSMCATKNEFIYIMASTSIATCTIRCYIHDEATGAAQTNTLVETAPTATAKYIVSGICRVSATRAAYAFTRFEPDWTRTGSFTANDFGPCTFTARINSDGTLGTGVSANDHGTPWTFLVSRPYLDTNDSKVYAWLASCATGHSKDFSATATAADAVQETGALGDTSPSESLVLCDLRYDEAVPATATTLLTPHNISALPKSMAGVWTVDASFIVKDGAYDFYQCLPTSVSVGTTVLSAYADRTSGDNTVVIRISRTRNGATFGGTHPGANRALAVGGGLFYGGGMPGFYDGNRCGEVGFMNIPWSVIYAGIVAGGSLAAGYYSYKYCFVRIYRDGSVVRSPMSLPTETFQIVAASGNYQINLQFPLPGVSEWVNPVNGIPFAQNTYLEIYRSYGASAASTEFSAYVRIPAYHGPMNMSIRASDDGTRVHPPLLADPSDLTVSLCQPPCFTHQTIHKNRIFGISNGALWFSNETIQGEGPRFPVSNVITSPGSPFVSVASMESTLVIFSKDRIWLLAGDGPDDIGQNSDYGSPQPLPVPFGSPHPRSIVEWPGGVGFMGPDFLLYNLNRGYAVDFIGEAIQEIPSLGCTDAVHLPAENLLSFVLFFQTNRKFVYDYQTKTWFEDTFPEAIGTPTRHASSSNTCRMLCSNGMFSRSALYYDTDHSGNLLWPTRKLKFGPLTSSGNPEGWQRTRSVSFAAEKKSPVGFTVNLYENFSSTAAKTKTKSAATLTAETASNEFFNEEVNVANPENQALEVEILDVAPASTADYGEGFHLVGLSFDTEPQNGMSRKAQTKKG